jgi:hypothetical protein
MKILLDEGGQDSQTGDIHEGDGMNEPQHPHYHPAIIGCLTIYHLIQR